MMINLMRWYEDPLGGNKTKETHIKDTIIASLKKTKRIINQTLKEIDT